MRSLVNTEFLLFFQQFDWTIKVNFVAVFISNVSNVTITITVTIELLLKN